MSDTPSILARAVDLRLCNLSHNEALAQARAEALSASFSVSGPPVDVNVGVACVTTPAPAGPLVVPPHVTND